MLWQQCCFDWFSYCTYRITIWLHCIINIIKLINQIILSATDFFNLFTILTYSGWLHEEYMRCPVCVFSFSIPLLVIYYRGLFVLNSSKIVKSCVLHFHKSEVNFCFIKLTNEVEHTNELPVFLVIMLRCLPKLTLVYSLIVWNFHH